MTDLPNSSPTASRSISLVRWLAASWVVLLVVGFSSLRMSNALTARNPVSFDRAVFTTVSVATETGFSQQFAQPTDFSPAVQWIFALQTLSGTLLSVVGGGVLLARVLKLPHSDSRIAATGLLMIVAGAVAGGFAWHQHESLMRAAFRGIGAISCTGLLFGPMFDPRSLLFSGLFGPLSLVGSCGAIVLLELFDAIRRRGTVSEHVRRVIALAATTYLVGTALLALLFVINSESIKPAMVRASTLFFTARGYGLPIEFAHGWERGTLCAILAIIAIGAGTAGTAGTLGLGWLATMPPYCQNRLRKTLWWQAGILCIVLIILLQSEPQLAIDQLLLIVLSAGMNVGLSHDPISITGIGLVVLAVAMLAGKLLPLLFLRAAIADEIQLV